MYSKILVPLDGSDLSHQAIPHAIELAKSTGADVVLLQVIDSVAQIISETTPATIEPIPSGELTVEIAEEAVSGQREAAEANLSAAVGQFVQAGVPENKVSIEVSEGQAQSVIVSEVERLGADCVVIATHGRSGLGRVLLGSVADHVARHTPDAAVMLVRPRDQK
jgi:nucleotide-binding universal stress UspA family protein